MLKHDTAFNGQTRYRISYYDRLQGCRTYYLNNTTFSSLKEAEREVTLLKRVEIDRIYDFKNRVRFKIEPFVVKNAINKSVK